MSKYGWISLPFAISFSWLLFKQSHLASAKAQRPNEALGVVRLTVPNSQSDEMKLGSWHIFNWTFCVVPWAYFWGPLQCTPPSYHRRLAEGRFCVAFTFTHLSGECKNNSLQSLPGSNPCVEFVPSTSSKGHVHPPLSLAPAAARSNSFLASSNINRIWWIPGCSSFLELI